MTKAVAALWILALGLAGLGTGSAADEMPRIAVSPDRSGFVLEPSGEPFIPWGFNYDHDEAGRLLEDYWETEWEKVESDFAEMKDLGATVVRIHLQTGKFMDGPDAPNEAALDRLARLAAVAEKLGLYLDVTGLGCYHKADVPAWYDALDEQGRWEVQARFWRAVAGRLKDSPAVFCYDLMNEPVVPGGRRDDGDWLGPPFAEKHFVQFITLDSGDRSRPDIARAWIEHLTKAVREVDPNHLVTVGLVDWSLDRPGLTSGFVPSETTGALDFLCVHIYPEEGKFDRAEETLDGFAAVGKPVVVEETFPLRCSLPDLRDFIEKSRGRAAGWISFYWGKTPEELSASGELGDAILREWLRVFMEEALPRFRDADSN